MLPLLYKLKNYLLVLCLALLTGPATFAQDANETTAYVVQQNEHALLTNSTYYYPGFKKGQVTFISGAASSATINYNMFNQEVEYINAKKDTLAFDDMYLIDMIAVERDTFFYDNRNACVLKLLKRVNGRKLLVKEQLPFATADQERPSTLMNGQALTARAYYISHQAEYVPATTANILKIFPAYSDMLKNYIAEHNLDLKTEEEIDQVLQYVASL